MSVGSTRGISEQGLKALFLNRCMDYESDTGILNALNYVRRRLATDQNRLGIVREQITGHPVSAPITIYSLIEEKVIKDPSILRRWFGLTTKSSCLVHAIYCEPQWILTPDRKDSQLVAACQEACDLSNNQVALRSDFMPKQKTQVAC